MEKIITWICRIIVLFGFGYNLISDSMSTQDKLFMILFIVSVYLLDTLDTNEDTMTQIKILMKNISRKDPRNEDT